MLTDSSYYSNQLVVDLRKCGCRVSVFLALAVEWNLIRPPFGHRLTV